MLYRFVRLTLIAAFAVLSLYGTAQVRNETRRPTAPPDVPNPGTLHTGNGGIRDLKDGSGQFQQGWNYVHVTNCYEYYYAGTAWLYVYPQEGGVIYTSDPFFQGLLAPACQTGNFIGVHFIDNNNDWDAIETFNYM